MKLKMRYNMDIQNELLNILKNNGNETLYQINNQKITYYECYKKVIRLANSLIKEGSSPIIVYGSKSIETFISILACLVARRIYIPIDIYIPKKRIREIIKITGSKLIIKNEHIEFKGIECLSVSEIEDKYKSNNYIPNYNNKIAYIIFTSGSTGNPKGVPISYANLSNFISWITTLDEHKYCHKINVLSQASFSFDLSLMDIYFSIFMNNHIIAINNDTKKDLSKIYQTIKENDINYLIMTPTFVKMLLTDLNFNELSFKSIKYMFFCGESLEPMTVKKIKERFPKVIVLNAYGPTEATCCVTIQEITEKMLEQQILPVGKINTAASNIEILDNEIVLKGASVFGGYLNNNNNCYCEEGINCYKTGDIGYIENDFLYCSGRKDSQVKYKGYRIELSDIENNLLRIDNIKEACCIAKYKDNSNIVKLIKAFVTIDKNITEEEIKTSLKELIPEYMIPKTITILPHLPINNNGKYDRKKLKEL